MPSIYVRRVSSQLLAQGQTLDGELTLPRDGRIAPRLLRKGGVRLCKNPKEFFAIPPRRGGAEEVLSRRRTFHLVGSAEGPIVALIVLLVALFLESCAAGGSGMPPVDISGAWVGASYPGCRSQGGVNCYRRPIGFSLKQSGSSISGSYSCPLNNPMCGTDNSGNVVGGRMNGAYLSDLRVVFSDATNCLYQGQFTAVGGSGEYMCFAGGGRIVEQGGWQLNRPPS